MAKKHIIDGNRNGTETIATDGHQWIFTKNSSVTSQVATVIETTMSSRNTISIAGDMLSVQGSAVSLYGFKTHLIVEKSAKIDSDITALEIFGNRIEAANYGRLHGNDYAVRLDGNNDTFVNSGRVEGGTTGVLIHAADNAVLINEARGKILGDSNAVRFDQVDDGNTGTFINRGLWEAPTAFLCQASVSAKIINSGTITGNVRFGDGDDTLNTKGGVTNGVIIGALGDDTLITDNASYSLFEKFNEGIDTVKSSVTYTLSLNVEELYLTGNKKINGTGNEGINYLYGNSKNNSLLGNGGSDLLDGRKGDDLLVGGNDADRFVFATGYGKDTVVDFQPGSDIIDLQNWKGIKSFNDVLAHAENHGNNVWIDYKGDTLMIQSISKNELEAAYFDI